MRPLSLLFCRQFLCLDVGIINDSGSDSGQALCKWFTFVKHRSKDGQVVLDGGTVPSPAPELMLALLNPQLDAFRNAGHDFYVVATESQLLGHQAGDRATQDRLGAQRGVLLPQCQGPATQKISLLVTLQSLRDMTSPWVALFSCTPKHIRRPTLPSRDRSPQQDHLEMPETTMA